MVCLDMTARVYVTSYRIHTRNCNDIGLFSLLHVYTHGYISQLSHVAGRQTRELLGVGAEDTHARNLDCHTVNTPITTLRKESYIYNMVRWGS